MSDLNLDTPQGAAPAASSEVGELKQACAQLQTEIFNLRLVLLVVVVALVFFFWREANSYKYEVALIQPQVMQATQILEALKKQDTSIEKQMLFLQSVINRLGEYAKVHPDYAQIMAKYGLVAAAPAGTPAPAPAKPAPAASAAKPAPAAAPKK